MLRRLRDKAVLLFMPLAVLVGLVSVASSPALASAPAALSISIGAKTHNPVVTKDVWTVFDIAHLDAATISGKVSGGAAGDALKLMERRFPFTGSATAVAESKLSASGTYAFDVKPMLATRYWVEVFPAGSHSPLSSSKTVVVYVTLGAKLVPSAAEACSRPVCREHFELYVPVPASAREREAVKHRYTYFGLALNATKEPPAPKTLKLVTDFQLGKVKKVSSTEYKYSLAFSFRINDDGYYFDWNLCTKDSESKDGMGLPGTHGCGLKKVSAKTPYIG